MSRWHDRVIDRRLCTKRPYREGILCFTGLQEQVEIKFGIVFSSWPSLPELQNQRSEDGR